MRKKWTYWRRAVISLLCVISCLPWGQLPAAAEPDMPEVLEETWKQNDGLLVPANEPAQTDTPEVTDDEAEKKACVEPARCRLPIVCWTWTAAVMSLLSKIRAPQVFAGRMRHWVPVSPTS